MYACFFDIYFFWIDCMTAALHLHQLWNSSSLVIQMTTTTLLLMSIASWTVMLVKGRLIYLTRQRSKKIDHFWQDSNFNETLSNFKSDDRDTCPFNALVLKGQKVIQDHRLAQNSQHSTQALSDLNERISGGLENVIDDAKENLGTGLIVLASIGATAPFVGLFGTVWGIYQALITIGQSGIVSIDRVAGPVGEALVMTAFGLLVAIPAVFGYNLILRGNQFVISKLNRFAYDLRSFYLMSQAISQKSY